MACKEHSGKTTTPAMSIDPAQWMSQYAQMNLDLMQAAIKGFSPWMTAWTDLYQGYMTPQMREAMDSFTAKMQSCCDIPVTGCPPRCACTLSWDAHPGEHRKATIRIHNSSSENIVYQLAATAFESCGKQIDFKPQVTPASIAAAPGQTVSVSVETDVGQQFQPGLTYHSEIAVRGKYERCVKVEVHVQCGDDEDCKFDHGDIPIRKRADDWYRHFQCSEPCFEPVQRSTNPTPTPGTNVPGVTGTT